MNKIIMNPIGVIHSPYQNNKNIPIQGRFKNDVEAWLELDKKYIIGLKDLENFSHCILIYYFHKSSRETLVDTPFLEDNQHGIFSIRSPHRPNHIGLSIVKIQRIQSNKLFFTECDMLDGTPLLDIKPYVSFFDNKNEVISGWLDKHFKNGRIPNQTIH